MVEDGVDRGVEVVVVLGGAAVDGDGPGRLVADSGGQGVGVAVVGGSVGPGVGGGVEGHVPGAAFEDPGVGVGGEVGCGGFYGHHLSVVVGGEQHEAVPGVGGVVVHGGEENVAVVVDQDSGDSVLLLLDSSGGFVEKVEGEFEFVVHGVAPFGVLSGAPVSAGERSIG
ncbi:hypothetical protein A5625_25020 [Mycobacterium sp. 1465703.0]|nr:hypothetical protein A5625_25020 [Mycobacterium sp. 1465703.0]